MKNNVLKILILCFLILVVLCSCKKDTHELKLPNDFSLDNKNIQYIHFSVDDSNSIFEDLTANENIYDSIFDQPILSYMNELHNNYGITVSFYVFYSWDVSKNIFDLSAATDKYKNEFEVNSDWLRFGFHAKDASSYETLNDTTEHEYYEKTIHELKRIVGEQCIDYFIRLDRYIADENTVQILKNDGVEGLLIADDPIRTSYSLSEEEQKLCYQNDWYEDDIGMYYTPTDVRIENIETDNEFYGTLFDFVNQKRIELFTHEWALSDETVKKYFLWYAQFANEHALEFSFSKK